LRLIKKKREGEGLCSPPRSKMPPVNDFGVADSGFGFRGMG